MTTDLDNYRDQLRHVARPADPSERQSARRVTLDDWEALFLAKGLAEYVAYSDAAPEHKDVARAYIEYIDLVVRYDGDSQIHLYAHSDRAVLTLYGAINHLPAPTDTADHVETTLTEAFGAVREPL